MNGFLNVVKPKGVTSHDVVLEVRHIFEERKVGHLGTLDPMAVGVLPIAVGAYTRLSEYLMNEDKEYLAEFTFGIATDTGDLDGRIISMEDCSHLTCDQVTGLLPKFTGHIEQVPPAFSAVHLGGKRLYDLARKGMDVHAPARSVHVDHIEMLHWVDNTYPRAMLCMQVGSGTYIRGLARDLGDELGCGCVVSYLLRTRVGSFCLKDAVTLDSLRSRRFCNSESDLFADPKLVFSSFVFLALKPETVRSIRHGVPLVVEDFLDPQEVLTVARHYCGISCCRSPVLLCTLRQSDIEQERIACAVSLSFASDSSFQIEYEKVLL